MKKDDPTNPARIRAIKALEMYQSGNYTLRSLAKELGISPARATQLVNRGARHMKEAPVPTTDDPAVKRLIESRKLEAKCLGALKNIRVSVYLMQRIDRHCSERENLPPFVV